MTTQLVIDIANRIHEIDARISAYAEGGVIAGCFRGKGKENYKYMISSRSFIFNNEGYNVKKAIEQAISELLHN